MKEAAVWAAKFKISDAKLEEWRVEAGPQEDLLRWCLLNGKINESEYLEWACRHFELPVVESDYFALEPDTTLFAKVKNESKWQPHIIPLHEWDNVLLIACVHPVPLQLSRPHRFVLAAASSLNFMWANLGASLETPPTSAPAFDAPDGLKLDLKFDSTPNAGGDTAAMPDGFLLKDSMSGQNASFESATETSSETHDAPDGLNFANLALPPAILTDITHPEIVVPNEAPQMAPPAITPEVEVSQPLEPVLQSAAADIKFPPLESSPPPVVSVTEMKPSMDDEDEPAAPVKGFADVTNINITMGRAPAPSRDDLKNYNDCATFEEATDLAFLNMKSHFEKSLMLVFQAGQLRPWRWTGTVQPVSKTKPAPIDLNGPSIFRIPFKTGLPYHGYVTPNGVNTAFFTAFNGGVTPKHVTIMPLMVSGRITGMIMGITENAIDLRTSLRQMENIAENLSQAFSNIRNSKKAA